MKIFILTFQGVMLADIQYSLYETTTILKRKYHVDKLVFIPFQYVKENTLSLGSSIFNNLFNRLLHSNKSKDALECMCIFRKQSQDLIILTGLWVGCTGHKISSGH